MPHNVQYISEVGPYAGDFSAGKRHGHGIQRWDNGRLIGFRYEGEWENDRAHGKGYLKDPGGACFEGMWRDNCLHGKASCRLSNGDLYEGEIRNGYPYGMGKWVGTEHLVKGEFSRNGPTGEYEILDNAGNVLYTHETEESRPRAQRRQQSQRHLLLDEKPNRPTSSLFDQIIRGWRWPAAINLVGLNKVSLAIPCMFSSDWISARVKDLEKLSSAAVSTICADIEVDASESSHRDVLDRIALKMWDRVPVSEQIAQFRRDAAKEKQARQALDVQAEDSTDILMENLKSECEFQDERNEQNLRSNSNAENNHSVNSRASIEGIICNGGRYMLGRASIVPPSGEKCGGILLDVSSAPFKAGDYAFTAQLKYGQPYVRMMQIGPRSFTQPPISSIPMTELSRYSGHSLLPVSKHPLDTDAAQIPRTRSARSASSEFASRSTKSGSMERSARAGSVINASAHRKQSVNPGIERTASAPSNRRMSVVGIERTASGASAQSQMKKHQALFPGIKEGNNVSRKQSKADRSLSPDVSKYTSSRINLQTFRRNVMDPNISGVEVTSSPDYFLTPSEKLARPFISDLASADRFEMLSVPEKISSLFPSRPHKIECTEQMVMTLGLHENNKMIHAVTSLDLTGHSLTELPPRISIMSNLEALNVSNNRLSKLPEELSLLSCLKVLKLRENRNLFNSLPICVLNLSWLEELDVSDTGLASVSSNLNTMSSLQTLDVTNNRLYELPLSTLRKMNSLTWLECSGNPVLDLRICGIPVEVVHMGGPTSLVHNKNGSSWALAGVMGFLRMPHLFSSEEPDDLEDLNHLFAELICLSRFFQGKLSLAAMTHDTGLYDGAFDLEQRVESLFSLFAEISPRRMKPSGLGAPAVSVALFQRVVMKTGATTRGKYLSLVALARSTLSDQKDEYFDQVLDDAEFYFVLKGVLKEANQPPKPSEIQPEAVIVEPQKGKKKENRKGKGKKKSPS